MNTNLYTILTIGLLLTSTPILADTLKCNVPSKLGSLSIYEGKLGIFGKEVTEFKATNGKTILFSFTNCIVETETSE